MPLPPDPGKGGGGRAGGREEEERGKFQPCLQLRIMQMSQHENQAFFFLWNQRNQSGAGAPLIGLERKASVALASQHPLASGCK